MTNASAPDNPLLTAPIPLMIRKIGIPVSIGAFFNTMFNVVDTIYGGLISDQALAALSLAFPITFIVLALGFGFSLGVTALIGNVLGEGDQRTAEKYGTQALVLALLVSLITTFLVIRTAPFLLETLGATDPAYKQLGLDYINPLFYGSIFFLVVQVLIGILNAQGNSLPGRNFLVGGFVLNLALNPWFIFGGLGLPPLGIAGIAWATVLVQALGCLYAGYEVIKGGLVTPKIFARDWVPHLPSFGRLSQQGLPNTIDILGVSVGFFILNYYVSPFGQDAVAALGSASRIEQVALLPVLGVNTAILALIAQNNGAGKVDRMYETLRTGLLYGVGLMIITMVLTIIFARPLMRLFTSDPEIIDIGVQYVRIRSWGLAPNAIFFAAANVFRGLKRPYLPLGWNMLRFVLLPWLFIYIYIVRLGYGLSTIWIVSLIPFIIVGLFSLIHVWWFLPPNPAKN